MCTIYDYEGITLVLMQADLLKQQSQIYTWVQKG